MAAQPSSRHVQVVPVRPSQPPAPVDLRTPSGRQLPY